MLGSLLQSEQTFSKRYLTDLFTYCNLYRMKRITIDLDDELYRKVKIRCAEDGVTLADVIRKLLADSLEKNPKKKVKS